MRDTWSTCCSGLPVAIGLCKRQPDGTPTTLQTDLRLNKILQKVQHTESKLGVRCLSSQSATSVSLVRETATTATTTDNSGANFIALSIGSLNNGVAETCFRRGEMEKDNDP